MGEGGESAFSTFTSFKRAFKTFKHKQLLREREGRAVCQRCVEAFDVLLACGHDVQSRTLPQPGSGTLLQNGPVGHTWYVPNPICPENMERYTRPARRDGLLPAPRHECVVGRMCCRTCPQSRTIWKNILGDRFYIVHREVFYSRRFFIPHPVGRLNFTADVISSTNILSLRDTAHPCLAWVARLFSSPDMGHAVSGCKFPGSGFQNL